MEVSTHLRSAAHALGVLQANLDKDVIVSPANEYEVLQLLLSDCRDRLSAFNGALCFPGLPHRSYTLGLYAGCAHFTRSSPEQQLPHLRMPPTALRTHVLMQSSLPWTAR